MEQGHLMTGRIVYQVHRFPAFDSVHTESLKSILRIYGILKLIVRVIKQIFYTDFCCLVRCFDLSYHVNSGAVSIKHGLRTGYKIRTRYKMRTTD